MLDKDKIVIHGARENNLKNIDLEIPKNNLVVFTGVSGSGKSTLAFDTIFAEGQRRYVESLSSYARQFLGNFEKPDVDQIDGLSPAISIDQKTTSHNPRSTVGTVTEIYDYLRLLFSRAGTPYCPHHNNKIEKVSIQQIVNRINTLEEGSKLTILAPIVHNEKGTHHDTLKKYMGLSFSRYRIDDNPITKYEEVPALEKNKKHNIDLVVDRLVLNKENQQRLFESIRLALDYANGHVVINHDNQDDFYSEHLSCPDCGFSIPNLEPRLFSFNNPLGCCEKCRGIGLIIESDPDKLIPDKNLTINQGAIKSFNEENEKSGEFNNILEIAKAYGFDFDTPIKDLTPKQLKALLYGPEIPIQYKWKTNSGSTINKIVTEGIKTSVDRLYEQTNSQFMKEWYSTFMSERVCPSCNGARLKDEVLAVKIANMSIHDVCTLSLEKLLVFIKDIYNHLTEEQTKIVSMVVEEIKNRVSFLIDVGLEYLNLSRYAMTLSGGESQRIRLATQIGSKLTGVLYVLDEPSIGLHQRDNDRLIKTLRDMRDLGNSLIVVEHDEDTIRAADFVVDIGPGAGDFGGKVIASGTPEEIENTVESITGQYLSYKKVIPLPEKRRKPSAWLKLKQCKINNLNNIDVKIPLGVLIVVSGVSGSGKSSLVNEVLFTSLSKKFKNEVSKGVNCSDINGYEHLSKVIHISQDPIGKTPRSNPATYIKLFDDIRDVFASTKEAKIAGFSKSMFSFNLPGGRCEHCQGDGVKKISMNFLPDVYVKCEVCDGQRYSQDVLNIKYKEKSIFDVLDMRVTEAYEFFKNHPSIERKLKTLLDVGLGYIKLGQSSTTLSGGEAQRVKLASELQKRNDASTLYIMDEPTTGLHTDDVSKLITIINRLVANGNSVVIIEHNLEVIKCADYIIDLGPEGGDKGGTIVATGTPEQVCKVQESYTGQYLKKYLKID